MFKSFKSSKSYKNEYISDTVLLRFRNKFESFDLILSYSNRFDLISEPKKDCVRNIFIFRKLLRAAARNIILVIYKRLRHLLRDVVSKCFNS